MKILFVVKRMTHVRHFDRVVRLLSDRGHHVCLASQDDDLELRGVLSEQSRITSASAPRERSDEWHGPANLLRRARDYFRYLHPRYEQATKLRGRSFEKVFRAVCDASRPIGDNWSDLLLALNKGEQKRLLESLALLETAIPHDPVIDEFLAERQPDVVICSPLVDIGFSQADFIKSARTLGLPSAMLVFSWDNLSNKGLIHEIPDRVFVWNRTQLKEAVKLHGVSQDSVVVTGAARFDELFEMRPSLERGALCTRLGFDPARPILTYLCSSKFIAAQERHFVERWIQEIRRSPILRDCSIIIRPHPGMMDYWHTPTPTVIRWQAPQEKAKASISRSFDDPNVVVMSSPFQNADQVLYETVYHSAAVVGLNTSAEIEAAIVGRPVYTIVDPETTVGQEGTIHFRYLLSENGGPVTKAENFDQHRGHLEEAVEGRFNAQGIRAFVQKFVRPQGIDVPVAPILADAIVSFAETARSGREAVTALQR
ncbi:MAG: hypothetical protein ABIR92_07005 [Gemmatimonadaceae bacterium]